MTAETPEQLAAHDAQVRAVALAVARLGTQAAPAPVPLQVLFEGAIKGAATALLSDPNVKATDVADLLEAFACEFRNLGKPNLHVVQ